MKNIILLFLINLLFAASAEKALTPEQILKKVPANSPDYTLDVAIVQKIKTVKYAKPSIDLNITNQQQYIKAFLNLIYFLEKMQTLPKKISSLNDKIKLLKNSTNSTDELQLIFYKKLLDIYEKEYSYISSNYSNIEKKLYNLLNNIFLYPNEAKKNLKSWNNKLLRAQKEFEKLNIDLQKWQILDKQNNIKYIQKLIDKNIEYQKKIYMHLFENQLVVWLNDIKFKSKKTFSDDNKLLDYAKHYDGLFYNSAENIVNDFENFAFGSKTLVYNTKKEISNTFDKIKALLNYSLFKVGNRSITPLNFLILILILVTGWYIGKYYKKLIYKVRKKYDISYSASTLLANMGYYTIITIAFLMALKAVGLDLSSLTIIAGALSVGIGFGLQNIVSNFVSGIILMFENSIKVGDYIQIDQDTRGEVIDISMRSTIIRTNDNIDLIVPNQKFIQNDVINWTLKDDIIRFRVPFGVEYGSDIDKVEKVVLSALANSNIPYVTNHPTYNVAPSIIFIDMGDNSLNFQLFIWVRGKYARRPRRTKSAFLKLIYNALNEAGIGIPFPQRDIHFKDPIPFEITLKKETKSDKDN